MGAAYLLYRTEASNTHQRVLFIVMTQLRDRLAFVFATSWLIFLYVVLPNVELLEVFWFFIIFTALASESTASGFNKGSQWAEIIRNCR